MEFSCVLSARAKGIIRAELQKGTYEKRKQAKEPAYMAPDPDPAEYSQVITLPHISFDAKC